ncbi:MAG: hypothetical protein V4441_08365 [Pseudomonadota bacterium]
MTIAKYLESFSVESFGLTVGLIALFLIVIMLQVRNTRWVRDITQNQASREAKQRLEKLISSVEKMTSSPKSVSKRVRPLNKGRKVVSSLRAPKAITPRRKHR